MIIDDDRIFDIIMNDIMYFRYLSLIIIMIIT